MIVIPLWAVMLHSDREYLIWGLMLDFEKSEIVTLMLEGNKDDDP